ncbi:hypothetical protein AgCh_010026 [Apium graveolens]
MVHDTKGQYFDWEQAREQPMNFDAKAFRKLLEEGRELLWHDCTKYTKLSTMATLLNIKADHNIIHECFESLLKAIKSMFPDNEKLSDNYYYYKKMVKKLGLGYKKIDACSNDCILFYKKNEKITKCTITHFDEIKKTSRNVKWKITSLYHAGAEMRTRVMRLCIIPYGKNDKKISGIGESHNWFRTSILWEFPYWSTNLIRHNIVVMHVEKNIFSNVFNTVMNVTGKTKDNDKAGLDLKYIYKRPALELRESSNGKTVKPHARYSLSKKQVEDVCTWIKSLKVLDGYTLNIARCVTDKTSLGK